MVAVLIVAMSIGLTSCSQDAQKEPKPDLSSDPIIGKWYQWFQYIGLDTKYYIEFKRDGTYSYVIENETMAGNYKIIETEKTMIINTYSWGEWYDFITETKLNNVEGVSLSDATLLKMLASGSNVFDQLWVYAYSSGGSLSVHLYSGNKRVRILGSFSKSND